MLGLDRRGDSTGHEFHANYAAEEHLRRYHGTEHLQASRSRSGRSGRRRRWRTFGTCVWKYRREDRERYPHPAEQGVRDVAQDGKQRKE